MPRASLNDWCLCHQDLQVELGPQKEGRDANLAKEHELNVSRS